MDDYYNFHLQMAADKWFWVKEWVVPVLIAIVTGITIGLLISPAFIG